MEHEFAQDILATEESSLLDPHLDSQRPPYPGTQGGSYTSIDPEYDEYVHLPWYKRPSITLLLPPFILYTIALGSIAVPKLNLIQDLICRQYFLDRETSDTGSGLLHPILIGGDNPRCNIGEIGALVSKFTLYLNLAGGIFAAFSAPRLGALSDRVGRRYIMAISTFGLFLGEIITILCYKYPETVSINWMILGSAIDGCLGSMLGGMAVTTSYATDCTTPSKRAASFGMFHGGLFFGIAIGPAAGGIVVEKTGNILSIFYAALACHLVFVSYILFILPESLSPRRRALAQEKHAQKPSSPNTLASFFNIFSPLDVFWPAQSTRLRSNLVLIAAIDFIMFGVGFGGLTVVIIYSKIKFQWRNIDQAFFVSIVSSTRVLGLIVLLPLIIKFFRKKPVISSTNLVKVPHVGCDSLDIYIVRVALILETLGYAIYGSAQHSSVFVAGGCLASIGGIGSPTLQSSLTKHVPHAKTGQVLGAIALMHCLARVIAPSIFNLIYAETAVTFPQTVFVFLGALFGLAFMCSFFIRPGVAYDDTDEEVERVERENLLAAAGDGEEIYH